MIDKKPKSQAEELATPFPAKLVKKPPKGKYGEYVKHSTVTERLLSIVGPFDYEIVQLVHGHAPAVIGKNGTKENPTWPAREHALVGCVARLTCEVDGVKVTVEEAGDVDDPAMTLDGRNLKDASSDAIKRCAMRLGLGLHLWSQDDYFLERQLAKDAALPTEETLEDEAADPEAEAVRARYRKTAEADEQKQADDAPREPEPEPSNVVEMPLPDEEPLPPDVFNTPPDDEEPPLDESDEIPLSTEPITAATIGRAKQYLEVELANEMGSTRMKCKGSCEALDWVANPVPCCKSAHLRRMYRLAEDGLQIRHDANYRDLLHQALRKKFWTHVSDLKKDELDKLISVSTATFENMMYGVPQ